MNRKGYLSLTAAALALAACSSPHPVPVAAVSYAPAAYGVPVGNSFNCYYVDDIDEVPALVHAGLCPTNSIAVAMPLAWHETYASYYASPAYYSTYIPVTRRTTYVNVTVVNFNKTYSSQISTASKTAVYKDNTGKTVSGSTLPTAKVTFGSGVKPAATFGSAPPPKAPADNAPKATFGNKPAPKAAPKAVHR